MSIAPDTKEEKWICPICGKGTEAGKLATVRQSWVDAGGLRESFGYVPPEARVHVNCDNQEQARNEGAR
jgi:hypothetical protein